MTGVDAGKDYEALARFSRRMRRRTGSGGSGSRLAEIMEPLLLTTPPNPRHPLDLLDQLKLAWRMRGLDAAGG